jgi:hypothetical protein
VATGFARGWQDFAAAARRVAARTDGVKRHSCHFAAQTDDIKSRAEDVAAATRHANSASDAIAARQTR